MTIRLRLAIALALMSSNSAFALTDDEGTSAVQFNFANPGARSLSMGGAFVALADDATAAYANPAGLTQLSRRELSVEGRYNRYSTPHLSDVEESTDGSFETTSFHDEARSSTSGASFLSAVFPFEHATVALYRHELMNFKTRFDYQPENAFLFPFHSRAELKDVAYGASVGWAVGERLRLGAGIAWHDFELDSLTTRDADNGVTTRQRQNGSDHGFGYTLGLRYLITDDLSLGMVYRRSPRFHYKVSASTDEANPGGEQVAFVNKQSDFDIPDVLGVGVSYRITPAFTLNFDVNRVRYSQLTDNISSRFAPEGADQTEDGDPALLKLRDGTEVRFGGEYVFIDMPVPLSLRAGVWRDPEHTLHYRGDDPFDGNAEVFSARTGDQTHYTFGLGLAFEQFSVDFGADLSKYYDTFSLAAVARF
ncbi:OmpP1/FadL family transporter [Pseudomonas indica]|uniref:Long-chain fatty acid transport protein n=1 Tax=Pseudomonas indica TaxID=137658 RepID=A0A1G9J3G2_9PSED|nr:outer membrane protein transport protein [Pseudomonas indica]MBU3057490.1 outer membrane protein transport protein [Pseudomonas indica]SDL32057.1 Long-chain fatty acid transport protein [Pseudomonas indica]